MARDDRPDPHRPEPTSPRALRASLSSSIGLGPASSSPGWPDDADETPPDPVSPGGPADRAGARHPTVAAEPAQRPSGRDRRGPARRLERRRRVEAAEAGVTIVPPQSVAVRALVLVVAIMGFLACLAVGTLAMIAEAAHDWQLDVSREVTIQIKPLDGVAIEPRLQKALDVARATRGVRSARLVGEREGEMLLEPWLGTGLDLSALPIPRLVVVELDDPATADLAGLEARIAGEIRGASVDDHAVWAARLRTMAGTMVIVGFAVVALMLTAMVLSVVFATRAAMAGNRDVIEVLHFVGAEDRFIAREFQRHFLTLGLQGGISGGVAAVVCFLVADFATRSRGDAFADQAQALFGGFSVGWVGYVGAAAVVGLVAVLTALTSRFTVLGQLGRLD